MNPKSPEIGLRWRIIRVIVGGPYLLALRVRVSGLDRIPAEGPAILAVNHVSVLDPIAVALAAYSRGRAIRFLAAAEFFSHPLTGLVLRGWGPGPVAPRAPRAERADPNSRGHRHRRAHRGGPGRERLNPPAAHGDRSDHVEHRGARRDGPARHRALALASARR